MIRGAVAFAENEPPDPSIVTPGVEGFIAFGILAVLMILLVLSMSRHLRKVDLRAAQQAADEAAAQTAEDGQKGAGGTPDPDLADGDRPDPADRPENQ
ncbi:MAG: hypothetical protein ACK5H2_06690 [Beutenbergiaceae bacterium]